MRRAACCCLLQRASLRLGACQYKTQLLFVWLSIVRVSVEEVYEIHDQILAPEVSALALVHVDEAEGVPLGLGVVVVELAVLDHHLGLDSEDVSIIFISLMKCKFMIYDFFKVFPSLHTIF